MGPRRGKEIEMARDVYEQEAHAVGVSRDGQWVVTAGEDKFHQSKLKVWEVETGIVRKFGGHSGGSINCIDISADSMLLAIGSWGGTVLIRSLKTGKPVAGPFKITESASAVDAIRFSQDSKKLAVNLHLRNLQVWDVKTQSLDGVRVGSFHLPPLGTHVPVFWTTNDKTIVAASAFSFLDGNTISEFDASTLETVGALFKGHTEVITSLALSLDCALLVSAARDNTIKLWAFESRQLLASFDVLFVHQIILSPNSRQLAFTALFDNICLCNILPDILASTRLARQPPRGLPSAPRHLSLVNPDTTARFSVAFRNTTMDQKDNLLNYGGSAPDLPGLSTPFATPLPPPPQNLTGYVIKDDDYPVARGGFGEIWKCTYLNGRRSINVAVKALQVYTTDQTSEAKRKKNHRIKHELRICAKLKHANVLPIYGYTHNFGPFIAIGSPWAENGNLTGYLEREGAALTLVRRFQILIDIIAGLQYLHANNVIHGDFNGPNVLINGDGTACIADFGLSLMYSEVISASEASWTSNLKGNVRWMAPELFVLEREDGSPTRPSEQSDIFSFGGIMLQVLTNKVPYYYLPNDAAIILAMHKSEKPSRSRYPALPEIHWQFIEQCWSTDPRDRPSTERADEVIRNEFHLLSRSP